MSEKRHSTKLCMLVYRQILLMKNNVHIKHISYILKKMIGRKFPKQILGL